MKKFETYFEVTETQNLFIGMPDEEPWFRPLGCSVCANGLANNVQLVPYLITDRTQKKVFEEDVVALCHECLCAYHNGDERN